MILADTEAVSLFWALALRRFWKEGPRPQSTEQSGLIRRHSQFTKSAPRSRAWPRTCPRSTWTVGSHWQQELLKHVIGRHVALGRLAAAALDAAARGYQIGLSHRLEVGPEVSEAV